MSYNCPGLGWLLALCLAGCGQQADPTEQRCGPASGMVTRVIDGDTIELQGGERIRYLLIDTPESTGGHDDCYGGEAAQFNSQLVLNQQVELEYDVECRDIYDRLLAYVYLDDRQINSLLVERGYACVLFIAPNGQDRVAAFEQLQTTAMEEKRGMWGMCQEVTCAD